MALGLRRDVPDRDRSTWSPRSSRYWWTRRSRYACRRCSQAVVQVHDRDHARGRSVAAGLLLDPCLRPFRQGHRERGLAHCREDAALDLRTLRHQEGDPAHDIFLVPMELVATIYVNSEIERQIYGLDATSRLAALYDWMNAKRVRMSEYKPVAKVSDDMFRTDR
jgi:hypothetical protein